MRFTIYTHISLSLARYEFGMRQIKVVARVSSMLKVTLVGLWSRQSSYQGHKESLYGHMLSAQPIGRTNNWLDNYPPFSLIINQVARLLLRLSPLIYLCVSN